MRNEPGPAPLPEHTQCSRRECRAEARWVLIWNNPAVHAPERRKTWLACEEHLGYLSDFLERRGFLRETVAVDEFTG
ncbi:hypothetical protein [Nocardiopsis ansamitocini]|uniref:Acetone carboxylase n=1 Tax=Nocardiopsis ansamitocini TaxID=1670832 RepID=A0A9W6P2C2_9ACTN|nr:hypothetical protein [Nocardiopsis ansamitocini]GLU45832.1 hypothetical protein Nans01_01830 [Nocardiopsis ansamitocini]